MKCFGQIFIILMLAIPWLFETFSFHLYSTSNPDFFIYSGARLPFFVVSLIVFGYLTGRTSRSGRYRLYAAGCIAATIGLIIVLYHVCDPRQCYYLGPDGLGEVRLAFLLSSCSLIGLVLGIWGRTLTVQKVQPGRAETNLLPHSLSINPYLAATVVAIFVGIYPASLLYNVPSDSGLRSILFVYYVSVPFLLAGFIFSQLRPSHVFDAILVSLGNQALLFFLFVPTELISQGSDVGFGFVFIQFAVAAGASSASILVGGRIGQYLNNHLGMVGQYTVQPGSVLRTVISKVTSIFSTLTFIGFAIVAMHPLFAAPIDLMPNSDELFTTEKNYASILSPVPVPMYYSAATNNENYFSTKRVEVNLNFILANSSILEANSSFLLAGIGAQSPNCCKDGLDYGYRADVLVASDGRKFILARAWDTCDQNVACSGFPRRSLMHNSIVPLASEQDSLALAMEWAKDGRAVNWYFRVSDDQTWTRYSSFIAPAIENPYFNLGVLSVNSLPFLGKANFFQTGVAITSNGPSSFDESKVIFGCPAFYDMEGNKSCFSTMAPVPPGKTEWKVLWGWGLDRPDTSIEIHDRRNIVTFTP